jgi:hypothetical protein
MRTGYKALTVLLECYLGQVLMNCIYSWLICG